MSKHLGFSVEVPVAFDAAVNRVRDELQREGFGVLTEIDLRAAFKAKLGRDFPPYVILGACNPPLASKAFTTDPSVGLLLPCNVTIAWIADDRTRVQVTDPEVLLSTAALEATPELADARERMLRVTEDLSKS